MKIEIIAVACLVFAAAYSADAHYTHAEESVPWFFAQTVHIQSGGNIQAGIIWDANTIVTSSHGIVNNTIYITDVYGNHIPGTLLIADPYSDVAVILAYTGGEPVRGQLDAIPGQWVYAVGHPKDRPYAVTFGIISSIHRSLPVSIQHDAVVSTGNSGGPLFTLDSRLVGMTVASDDLAFAVPYEILDAVVQSMHETGTYAPGCIGIVLDDNTIRTVRDEVAGILHPGDVIMSIDGKPPSELQYDRSAGEYVVVVLENRTVQVQLGYMGEWFGIHRCMDSPTSLDRLTVQNLMAYTDGDRVVVAGDIHNIGSTELTSLTLDRLAIHDLVITQDDTTGDMALYHNGTDYEISSAAAGTTTFHFGETFDIDLTGLTVHDTIQHGLYPMTSNPFRVVITSDVYMPSGSTMHVIISGTDGNTTMFSDVQSTTVQ